MQFYELFGIDKRELPGKIKNIRITGSGFTREFGSPDYNIRIIQPLIIANCYKSLYL
jgi:hypothetical protein